MSACSSTASPVAPFLSGRCPWRERVSTSSALRLSVAHRSTVTAGRSLAVLLQVGKQPLPIRHRPNRQLQFFARMKTGTCRPRKGFQKQQPRQNVLPPLLGGELAALLFLRQDEAQERVGAPRQVGSGK